MNESDSCPRRIEDLSTDEFRKIITDLVIASDRRIDKLSDIVNKLTNAVHEALQNESNLRVTFDAHVAHLVSSRDEMQKSLDKLVEQNAYLQNFLVHASGGGVHIGDVRR